MHFVTTTKITIASFFAVLLAATFALIPGSAHADDSISPLDNPDLTITKIVRNPESNYIDLKFKAYVYIKNTGGGTASLSGAHTSLAFGANLDTLKNCGVDCSKKDGMYYGYYDLGEQIDSLASGEEKAFLFESTVFNGDLVATKAGTYHLYAKVDNNNAVTESNEDNNIYSTSFDVVDKTSPFENATPTPAKDTKIEDINAKAKLLREDSLGAILSELKQLRNRVKEQENQIKYLKNLTTGLKQVADAMKERINNFITYGVDNNTQSLGEGERAAVMYSFKEAFDKLPETEEELADSIKIANGRWPSARSEAAENWAKEQFKRIYKRDANMDNPHDNAAITVMAYGLRQLAKNRNLSSEENGIKIFKGIYGHVPSNTKEWNIMQAITYSGATR